MSSTAVRAALARATAFATLTGVPAVLGLLSSSAALAQSSDPVVFSFATVGDSRQDPASPDPTTKLSVSSGMGTPSLTGSLLPQDAYYLQNSAAWSTIQAGILGQGPNLLFFNGDMIYGYGRPTLPSVWTTTSTTTGVVAGQPSTWTGSQTVTGDAISDFLQYGYWRGTVANLFSNGIYVMPVPGNHETQCSQTAAPYSSSTKNNCSSTKTAYADNESMFRYTMSDLVNDLTQNYRFSQVTGFVPQNVNTTTPPVASTYNGAITGDQTDLSYSFDIATTGTQILHFVVINTDPSGADATPPADWVASDLAAAAARGASKFFVFGHKPAFTYQYGGHGTVAAGGLDAGASYTSKTAANPLNNFWSTLVKYHATYFAGHEHVVNVQPIADPLGVNSGSAFQVMVGAGGSPFDDKLIGTCTASTFGSGNGCSEPTTTVPYDRYYGWAYVQIHASGLVTLSMTGFQDTSVTAAGAGPTVDMTIYDVPSTAGSFPGVTTLQ